MMKKEKKTHGVQLLLRMVVKEPNGRIISDTGHKPSKSFVRQFLEFIYAVFIGTTRASTDVLGTEKGIYHATNTWDGYFHADAPINESDYGIVIGTGDTPEDNSDFALDVQLTEGVGAGRITHGAQATGTTGVEGANVDLVLSRSFTNNTGSAIGVKEAGIYVINDQATYFYHMIIRDVLGATVNVPDKCSLSVYYTLRTTV